MSKLMFIDGNSIGFANHSGSKLTVGGREVQAIFGFIKSLRKLMVDYAGYKPLVLWDDKAHWRYELYPEYKGKRNADSKMAAMKDSYDEQRPYIRMALKLLGVSQLTVDGYEADDMAGYLTKVATESGNEVLLISGDKDWVQLVGERCTWFDPIRSRHINHKTFTEQTSYEGPQQFVEAKALTGDTSDCIRGVGGIGEKTVPDFMMQYGSVENFLKLAEDGNVDDKLSKPLQRLISNEPFEYRGTKYCGMQDSFKRNMKLMDLRNVQKPPKESVHRISEPMNLSGFINFCEKLNFQSILKKMDSWLLPFEASK